MIFEAVNEVFDALPIAAVVDDRILCVHGGIPSPQSCPGPFEQEAKGIPCPLKDPETSSALAWELMWSDPARLVWCVVCGAVWCRYAMYGALRCDVLCEVCGVE